jgi:cell division protein FtsQ
VWDNPRILNLAAGALVGIAAFVFAIAGLVQLLRSPFFPVRAIEVTTPLAHTTKAEIGAAVQGRISGNFFAVSPDDVRQALEKLPWVRTASVRRVWPDALDVAIEEHVAFARWGDDALLNQQGERFFGKSAEPLPQLIGPVGSEREVAYRYARFASIVAPLGKLDRVVLTRRLAWQLHLAGGLDVMLGRDGDQAEARLRRFVSVYDATLGQIPRRHDYVDLRYPNGFALRVPDSRS